MNHGTNGGYRSHQRHGERPCPACRDAHNTYRQIWLRRVAKNGRLTVDATPYGRALTAVRGMVSLERVSQRSGVARETLARVASGKKTGIHRRTAERLDAALRELQTEQADGWERCVDHLDYAKGDKKVGGRWPTAAVLEWARGHGVSLNTLSDVDRRYLYRSEMLDTDRAERVARGLGVDPEQVWGMGWFGLDEDVAS